MTVLTYPCRSQPCFGGSKGVRQGNRQGWWKLSIFRPRSPCTRPSAPRVWRHTQGSSKRPALDLGWGSGQPGSGVAVDWVTGWSCSSARRRLNARSGQRKDWWFERSCPWSWALKRCLREADGPVRRVETSVKRLDGWKVVAPGCAWKPSRRAGEEPEDHTRNLKGKFLEDIHWTDQAQRENTFSKRIGDWGPSSSRKLCKKSPRNWKVENTLLSGRKWLKTTKIGRISHAARSGITNSESILPRSWLTEQLWHTYVPHQALITSSSRKPSREVGMIVNMLDEILMNYTMIQEIWQHHQESLMISRNLRKGVENSGSEEPLLSIPLPCFSASAKRKSLDDKQVLCLWLTMPWVFGIVLKWHDNSELSHLGDASAKFPDQTEFQSWIVNFQAGVCAKAKNLALVLQWVDQEIEATSSLKDFINPNQLREKISLIMKN